MVLAINVVARWLQQFEQTCRSVNRYLLAACSEMAH